MAALSKDPYELEALVGEASFRGLASEAELREQIVRNSGRPGVVPLRNALDVEGGPQRTRSQGERNMLRILRKHRIKGFEANGWINGFEVDFLWRKEMFCVELDGWDGHKGRQAFERDRLKWAKLEATGVAVMPITARQVRQDECGVVGRLLSARANRRR